MIDGRWPGYTFVNETVEPTHHFIKARIARLETHVGASCTLTLTVPLEQLDAEAYAAVRRAFDNYSDGIRLVVPKS